MYDMILVRYGEMTLKKSNYKTFLNKINQTIKNKLKKLKQLEFFNTDYRFYIYLNGENHNKVLEILDTIAGLYSYSLCKKVIIKSKDTTIEDISKCGINVIEFERPQKPFSMKVETNRGNKDFPLTSIQISQMVAKGILPHIKDVSVDVHNPDLTLSIDLRTEGTYIYTKVIKGMGGYPSGMAGNGLVMISGGLDSPVAAYLSIRKGINVSAIHFASPPYTSDMALQKVVDLLETLAKYTDNGYISLYVVPFTKVQTEIHNKANNIYMITLMRRAMYKIASKVAKDKQYQCLINGESIGQVASQTLESMMVVNEVTNMTIIRPLATYDKDEIISVAKKIKTFDISIKPYEDCCTVFVPEHPSIKPKINIVLSEEKKCDLDALIEEAYQNVQVYKLQYEYKTNVFDMDKTGKFQI